MKFVIKILLLLTTASILYIAFPVLFSLDAYSIIKLICFFLHRSETETCDISQDCPAGLNFANEDEAFSFRNAVNDKIQTRQRRRETTRQSLLLFLL